MNSTDIKAKLCNKYTKSQLADIIISQQDELEQARAAVSVARADREQPSQRRSPSRNTNVLDELDQRRKALAAAKKAAMEGRKCVRVNYG